MTAPQSSCSSLTFPASGPAITIHSPKKCLPGARWFPQLVGLGDIPGLDHRPFAVNRCVTGKGEPIRLVSPIVPKITAWHRRSNAPEHFAEEILPLLNGLHPSLTRQTFNFRL
jgi:hypothetical protein